jgi:protein SCO1/2
MTANLFEVQKRLLITQSDAFPYCVSRSRQCTGFKRYAIKYGVNDKKWNLVTGDKKEIYTMARKSY